MPILQTYVAPLLRSNRSAITRNGRPIYWLDELFEGGIVAPEDLGRPLVILLCGPPGAGKSILLQQLAYARATNALAVHPEEPECWPRSVLISTEVTSAAVAANMESMGMPGTAHTTSGSAVHVMSTYDYNYSPNHKSPATPTFQEPIPPTIIVGTGALNQSWEYLELIDHLEGAWEAIGAKALPDLLAIDSLNILADHLERSKERRRNHGMDNAETETEKETEFRSHDRLYKRITALTAPPKFFVLVLDTPATSSLIPSQHHQFWEYAADVIIRLDYRHGTHDYFMRYFEIIKARFQPYALGRQLVKIFRRPLLEDDKQSLDLDPEGPIPNIERGGLFFFPSEHFVLSKIRAGVSLIDVVCEAKEVAIAFEAKEDMKDSLQTGELPAAMSWGPGPDISESAMRWPVEWFGEMVGGGIPRKHTTALIGKRGLHKSYLGYQFLLDGVANGEPVLLVSFRDNLAGVRSTLNTIVRATQYASITAKHIDDLVRVVYQRPGYVSPQELLHRIITAVGERTPRRAVINAVDQWHAGHPLLAESAILLPCLIDFLNTQGVTSMIIGVESGATQDTLGLTAKAEVVVAFDQCVMPWCQSEADSRKFRKSRGEAIDAYPKDVNLCIPPVVSSEIYSEVVLVRAVRVPHGRAGLARGVLEYVGTDSGQPAGLKVVPIAPEYAGRVLGS